MPVVETVVRVPGGDAVQRVYAVAEHGGLVVVEVANESSEPFALALLPEGPVVLGSSRPASTVPVEGVTLPAGAQVWPVAHRTSLRVVLPLSGSRAVLSPGSLPDADAVVRGWLAQSERILRVEVPDDAVMARLRAARADTLLDDDPAGALLVGGGRPDEVAAAVFALTRPSRRGQPSGVVGPSTGWALCEAEATLAAMGEPRAAADVRWFLDRLAPPRVAAAPATAPVEVLAEVRGLVVREGPTGVELLPDLPVSWLGGPVEAHEIATRHGRVSFAVRWHGARPALLWECDRPITLTCPSLGPDWSDGRARGEALLAGPSAPSFA